MKKSQAFTLAEVLITLVIIGVIAAMTIPTLMGSTNKQEMRSSYKKALSMLNQAAALDYALYGNECCTGSDEYCAGAMIDDDRFARILKNHMSIINDEGTTWKTADGMIYRISGPCMVEIDLNGDKGNGQLGEDVFGAWISLVGDTNSHHTFIPNRDEWDDGASSELLN